jgi:hypothetical protein
MKQDVIDAGQHGVHEIGEHSLPSPAYGGMYRGPKADLECPR